MVSINTSDAMEQLQRLRVATEREMEELRAGIAPLERRLNAARERLDLIQRLIRLTDGGATTPERAAEGGKQDSSNTDSPVSRRQDLEAHMEQILGEVGKPMHISDIRRALVDRAVPLPGRGDEANIILRLRRAPERFTRTGRGTYALATLGLKAVPPKRRRRKVRIRAKA